MQWLNQYLVLDSQHVLDLEREAAVNSYQRGMSKSEAENASYDKYKKCQHAQAAAYHLDGLEDAKTEANVQKADKHWAMYSMHAKELGLNPKLAVDTRVQAYRQPVRESSLVFEPHPADLFVLQKPKL